MLSVRCSKDRPTKAKREGSESKSYACSLLYFINYPVCLLSFLAFLLVAIKTVLIVATCASEHFENIKLGNEVPQCHRIVHETWQKPTS
jgi:hypothetical protein